MALPDRFDTSKESELYERWVAANCFTADAARSKRAGGERDPFTIVIPPPNVTAILHLGHALDDVTQDVLIRWARMRGQEALWVPGTDHAGIATQNVVEKLYASEGKTRMDVGREAFIERTKQFVAETGGTILKQLRAIGASLDWTRSAYTFSPELSRAVREAFNQLYEKGLVYRGHRVIHWCPRCKTSLSDEEAEFQEEDGALYHIKYAVSGHESRVTGHEFLIVATTRPETMLGDVAVAVNAKDPRYAKLIGKNVILPILDLEIPVIADDYADPEFGTGVVKITPAHDANDYEVGKRHNLPMPVVINDEAIMEEVSDAKGRVPEFVRFRSTEVARDLIKRKLKEIGALEKTESKRHSVRHCYRCDTVVEPRLSDQWFVKMAPLAKPALEGLRAGAMRILPQRWEAVYVNWLEGIRDWNISRQLWWGHRIPVWYCKDCDPPYDMHVSRTDLTKCPHCGGPVKQDEDVLDTWFSSWLWPISTLGWPDKTKDMDAFYPTDVLVSGPDIIFFWVARMVMAGYFFTGRSPYHTVLLHGMARDEQGRKMSKSLGNGVDPMQVLKLYGADAMRWTLVSGMGLGADITLDPNDLEKTFATGRNFVTKLWNIARFLLEKAGSAPVKSVDDVRANLTNMDEWILWRLDLAIAECDAALGPQRPTTTLAGPDKLQWTKEERVGGMRLNDLAETGRRFVWTELADSYLESIKERLEAGGSDADVARAVLVHAFDGALRLLHPIVPFVTEAVWQQLPSRVDGEFLATATWPARDSRSSTASARAFGYALEAVTAIRQARVELGFGPGEKFEVYTASTNVAIRNGAAEISRLARAKFDVINPGDVRPGPSAHLVLSAGDVLVVPTTAEKAEKTCARLRGELASLEKQLTGLEGRLANEKFTSKAPADVIAGERAKLAEWSTRRQQLRDKVQTLCGG